MSSSCKVFVKSRKRALPYNRIVPPAPLALDTPLDVERRQIEAWRGMSSSEKAALVSGLTGAVYELARAGIRARHPDAAPREQLLRLAIVTLGIELAREAYPEIVTLNLL
jgi:hypothetical protein